MAAKKTFSEIELKSIKILPVFSMGTCVFVILSIVSVLIMDSTRTIELKPMFELYVPTSIFTKIPYFNNLYNPFTLSVFAGLILGLGGGVLCAFISVAYNLFAQTMGGIKFEIED